MMNSQMRMIEMMKIYRSVKQTNQQVQQQQLQQLVKQQQQLVSQKATDTKELKTKESIPSEKKDPAPSEENDESKIEKLTETTEDGSDMKIANRQNDIVTDLETIPSISERQALVKPPLRARFINGIRKILISVRRPFSRCFGSQQ